MNQCLLKLKLILVVLIMTTKVAFIDLETIGLPILDDRKYYPFQESSKYDTARVLQITIILVEYENKNNANRKILETHDYYVTPDRFEIANTKIHGITEAIIKEKGIPMYKIIENIRNCLTNSDCLVAHNIGFDYHVLCSELYRLNEIELINNLVDKQKFCTSVNCANITKIKRHGRYKQPKLSELYIHLFGMEPVGLHNALVDTNVLMQCFNSLVDKKVIEVDETVSIDSSITVKKCKKIN